MKNLFETNQQEMTSPDPSDNKPEIIDEIDNGSNINDIINNNNNNGIPDVMSDFDEFAIGDLKPFVQEDEKAIETKTEESIDDKKSIELFNKEFGTEYKTKKEIEDLLNSKKGNEKEVTADIAEIKKLEDNYEHNKSVFDYLQNLQNKSDRDVIYNNEKLIAINKAKENQEEFDQEEFDMLINEKLETWENYGSISFNAQQVREKIKEAANEYKQKLDKVDNHYAEIENKKVEQKINSIKNELHSIFENKMFMGVAITKEDIASTYEDIIKNKFAEQVNNSPQLQVKLALMLRLGNEITKRATRPTASDGIKSILDEFSPSTTRTQTLSRAKGNGVISNAYSSDKIKGFLS